MNISYFLRGSTVYLDIHLQDGRIKYSTEEQVNPKKWDSNKKRLAGDKEFNKFLDDLTHKLRSIRRELILSNQLSKESFKQSLDVLFGKKQSVYKLTDWLAVIQERKKLDPTKNKNYPALFQMTIDRVKSFQDSPIDKVDKHYMEGLKTQMLKDKYSINSVRMVFRLIKHSLNEAYEENILAVDPRRVKMKLPKYHVIHPYHTSDELDQIERTILPSDLDFVRDLYLIGCETGLRVNKWMNLDDSYIQGDIVLVTDRKTGTTIKIPMTKRLASLLSGIKAKKNKNKKVLGKSQTNYYQNVLSRVPKICRIAGIDQPIRSTRV